MRWMPRMALSGICCRRENGYDEEREEKREKSEKDKLLFVVTWSHGPHKGAF